MIDRILSRTSVLEKTLDATWQRNEAIAQNISNIDTPGYKRKTVEFEGYLSQALDKNGIAGFRTHKKHIPIGRRNVNEIDISVKQDNKSLSMRLDGNNVDIDNEMALMAKNSIKYNTLIQRISGQFRQMKSVINEGRK